MKIFLYISSIAVLFAGGCVSGRSSYRSGYDFDSLEKIAVVSIEGAVQSETAKDQIAEFFAMEFLDNGYAPIGRAQVRAFLRDEEIELADLVDGEEDPLIEKRNRLMNAEKLASLSQSVLVLLDDAPGD